MKPQVPRKTIYQCDLCEKELLSKQTLKQHISIHNGLKPLKCTQPECNASFAHASQLSSHKKKHKFDIPNRLDFKSIKQFIFLFLEVFESQNQVSKKAFKGSFKKSDLILPKIILSKSENYPKLPLPETLNNLN